MTNEHTEWRTVKRYTTDIVITRDFESYEQAKQYIADTKNSKCQSSIQYRIVGEWIDAPVEPLEKQVHD